MMMIKLLNKYHLIKEGEEDIYRYALFVIAFNLLTLATIALVAFCLHCFNWFVMFALFFIPLHMSMGGMHMSTPVRCFFSTHLIYLSAYLLCYIGRNSFLPYIFYMIYLFFLIFMRKNCDKKVMMLQSLLLATACFFAHSSLIIAYAFFINMVLVLMGIYQKQSS